MVKIAYKKKGAVVEFHLLCKPDDRCESVDHRFCLDFLSQGDVWEEDAGRLENAARGCADINRRKNVMPTEADEGLLY